MMIKKEGDFSQLKMKIVQQFIQKKHHPSSSQESWNIKNERRSEDT